jgi:hypothetical protein
MATQKTAIRAMTRSTMLVPLSGTRIAQVALAVAVTSLLSARAPAQEAGGSAATPAEASAAAADSAGTAIWPPKRREGRRPPIGGLNLPMKAPSPAPKPRHTSPYHGTEQTDKSREYYANAWGVDHMRAAYTSSGNLIRFTFRVVQPQLAKPLGDRTASPYLYAPKSHALLQVPTMEKIGQLRQLGELEAEKEYWMVFSNKGNLVHPGDRVDVMIGKFHAGDLLVE